MIILITPTGFRARQFELLKIWMLRQTYLDEVAWIIVDDCIPITTNCVAENFKDKWTIIKIYPSPVWKGQNSQARNIGAGIKVMRDNFNNKDIEAVFIIEDDDYYRPDYLERMMINFKSYHLIGERNTIYYNVVHRRYITNANIIHASLFQTAFKIEVLPIFESCYSAKFIDCVFWSKVRNNYLFYENDLAIGMKGMSGRGGIGAGHSRAMNMKDDSSLQYLQKLIGTEDAKYYEEYYILYKKIAAQKHRANRYGINRGRDILTRW